MLNLPAVLEYPLSREIGMGLIYGTALAATFAKPRRLSKLLWCGLIVACGYLTLALCQSWDSQWTLCRTWALALLVYSCWAVESVRQRIENHALGGNHAQGSRQYAIADLLVMTTGIACFAAGIRQTSLSDQEPVFWTGMILIGAALPCCVVSIRLECSWWALFRVIFSLVGSALVAVGLAWTESTIVQPQRIVFDDAALRYGGLIAATMMPRFLFQIIHLTWASLPMNHAHNDSFAMPCDGPRGTDSVAVEQTQPALKLLT